MGFFNKNKVFVKKQHKDPVCGMSATDAINAEYNGIQYYFCSEHCKQEFQTNPLKYIKQLK